VYGLNGFADIPQLHKILFNNTPQRSTIFGLYSAGSQS
jgi:hypothetical protein